VRRPTLMQAGSEVESVQRLWVLPFKRRAAAANIKGAPTTTLDTDKLATRLRMSLLKCARLSEIAWSTMRKRQAISPAKFLR
jgi:hypothetical protein